MTALDGAAAEAVVWRQGGVLRVTVAVKASFALAAGASMTLVEPQPILRTETRHGASAAASVQLTPDLAPFQPRADVLLTGHAHAPAGTTTSDMAVRLALHGAAVRIDKTVGVRADRRKGEVVPFARMPLTYDRAYGGIGYVDNPLGRGAAAGDPPPNLFDRRDPHKIACFGPLSRALASRKRLLGELSRDELDAPIIELPEGFDWSYFQAAPADQQCDYLAGDEILTIEGCHPEHARIESRLPGAHAEVRIHGLPSGRVEAVRLAADILRVDADALTCSLTWRGTFAVPSEDVLLRLRVLARAGTELRPVAWPEADAAAPDIEDVSDFIEEAPSSTDNSGEFQRTVTLDPLTPLPQPTPFPAPSSARSAPLTDAYVLPFRPADLPPGPAALPLPVMPAVLPVAPAMPGADATLEPLPPPPKEPEERAVLIEGIPAINHTRLALGVQRWRLERDCLTVIVKASCDLAGGSARVRAQADALEAERRSYPGDLAPYKVRADVMLVGHARPPAPVAEMEVRFRFGHAHNAFERALLVFGDRAWSAGRRPAASAPQPFVVMPLGWERAFGGPRFAANPAGIGHGDAMRRARPEPLPLPNLEDPEQRMRLPSQTPAPASFAPRPLAWKERADEHAWPFFPEELDWTRHQAAPAAQQLALLDGDEPFAIAGCAPETIEGALPGIAPRCLVARDGVAELPLRLDTVLFDVDARRLQLVWRGWLGVADERAPGVRVIELFAGPAGEDPPGLSEARARLLRR